jgi:hypothetical protein
MSEKHLTEPPWKILVAKHKVKDLGLQKALAGYDKIDSTREPAPALELIKEIADLAAKLKKANSSKEEVVAHLDEVIKEAKKTTPVLEARAKSAAATATAAAAKAPAAPKPEPAGEEEEAEQEEESPDIKVRLANALKKVKAAAGKDSFAFVACIAKPFYGVLLAKSPTEKIGAPHKKLLTELTAGTKFIVGSCLFENEAHTFVVDSIPAGLAKNLKKSIKEFTGVNCKVRVRDAEGNVADADTEIDPEEAQAAAAETPPAAPPAPPAADSAEAMNRFTTRFKALQPDILKAIVTKTPPGEEIKQRAAEAGTLAGKKNFEQAHQALDAVESLLKKLPAAPAPAPAPPPTGPPRDVKLSTYLTGRANLRTARENAAKELVRLQQAILAKSQGEPFYAEVEAGSQKLFDFLAPIDDAVVNKLDEAGKCLEPEVQVELNKKVRELIQKQLTALRTHALSSFVEKNPFGKFIIKQPLEVTLSALDKQLS